MKMRVLLKIILTGGMLLTFVMTVYGSKIGQMG